MKSEVYNLREVLDLVIEYNYIWKLFVKQPTKAMTDNGDASFKGGFYYSEEYKRLMMTPGLLSYKQLVNEKVRAVDIAKEVFDKVERIEERMKEDKEEIAEKIQAVQESMEDKIEALEESIARVLQAV